MKLTKKLEHPMDEDRLREVGFFWPGEEKAQVDAYKYLMVFTCINT